MRPYNTLPHVVGKGEREMHVGVATGNPVIAFSGEIDLATASGMLWALEPWVRAGGPVTVDLSQVTFMDSTGVHALVDTARTLGDRGCIVIHGAHNGLSKVFELLMLQQIPNIHVIDCCVLVEAAS
jgi:anti-anti-sigma factor